MEARTGATLTHVPRPNRRGLIEAAVLVALIVATAVAGYVYYGVRTARKLHDANLELERKIQEQQMQQAAAAKVLKAAEGVADAQTAGPIDGATDSDPKSKAGKSPNTAVTHRGELRFTSKPSGASVEIDGWSEARWVTPFKASNLAPGPHTIVFSKPGYVSVSRTSTVTRNRSVLVSQVLRASVTVFSISSKPAGAKIMLDGKDTLKTTPARIRTRAGEHIVVLHKAGYRDASLPAVAEEGQAKSVSASLQALPPLQMEEHRPATWRRMLGMNEPVPAGKGVVHIRTLPEGATILVDDRVAPLRAPVRWAVAPGVYHVTLKLAGYRPVSRSIHVEPGRVTTINEVFARL